MDDRDEIEPKQRGLFSELVGFVFHCCAVLLILIVIAIFARDWSTVYHQIVREGRQQSTENVGKK